MSVYVGIDVHRKRCQVAVVTEDGTVQLNKNVVNGSTPMLRLIGDLPSGTPVASGALALLIDRKRSPEFAATCQTIAKRRGKKIAAIAISRKLLTRAWHLLAAGQAAGPATPDASAAAAAHPQTGRVTQPRASSHIRHEPAAGRARSSD
jgi:hypothetical protein